jgi:threonine/homoserine/homoserine lactone efflux protein
MFFKGLLLGFSVAAPIGPINLLCIQRTLSRGRQHGFVSGLGAATADTLYGLVAALGLSAITSFLLRQQFWLQLGGGVFLLCLGLKTALTSPQTRAATGPADDAGLVHAYFTILVLTLANPATILAFFAVFAALGIGTPTGGAEAALVLVAGVFLGSSVWWLLLSFLAGFFRAHLTDRRMRTVNLVAGITILALGLWSLWPLVTATLL